MMLSHATVTATWLLAVWLLTALSSAAPSPAQQQERAFRYPSADTVEVIPETHQQHNKRAIGPITEWTAMGDSYASGVGAGNVEGTEKPCRRFSESYGRQMDSNPMLHAAKDHKFNNPYCSGSSFKDIHSGTEYSQVDKMGSPDMATLTIGGNNVGFRDILIACIYKFYPFGRNGNCDETLQKSLDTIGSDDFEQGLSQSIQDAINHAKKDSFRIHVTGYAAFFNEDTTQCNSVSVAMWYSAGGYWTQDFRKKMNNVLRQLNERIRHIVAGFPQDVVKFINVDNLFEGHRFCEPSVKEPDLYNPDVWFYHWYKDHDELIARPPQQNPDLNPSTPKNNPDLNPRPANSPQDSTSPQGKETSAGQDNLPGPWDGFDAATCDPNVDDWGDALQCLIAKAHADHPDLKVNTDVVKIASGSGGISSELARVFHPKTGGQSAYADAILHNLIR